MTIQQEVFDRVVTHLLTQNARSTGINGKGCKYRNDKGLKCAVGCLIPDERYTPDLESNSATRRIVINALPSKYRGDDINELLCRLQILHDMCKVKHWPDAINDIATECSLNLPKIMQADV